MSGQNPRPKIADGAVFCLTICLMGAPEILGPKLNHGVAQAMFFGGLIAVVLYVIFRWGKWAWRELFSIRGKDTTPIPFDQLADADLKTQASKWLATKLSDNALHVCAIALFGSVVHDHYRTSDVDVVVRFKSISNRRIASAVRSIRSIIAADFHRTFGHKLHVTVFCAGECAAYEEFLVTAGKHELIYTVH